MKLLLDTHTFIWFINGDDSLSKSARKEILKSSNIKFVSIACIWEMAIKISLDKLKIHFPFKEIRTQINDNGFEILPLEFEHTYLISRMEFHHRDPFDRIIIAQAIEDDLIIVSRDKNFQHYNVKLLW